MHEAELACQKDDPTSSLVSIKYPDEQKFIENHLFDTLKISDNPWIGAKRQIINGLYTFRWSDKSNLEYTNWAPNNPTSATSADCVQLQTSFSKHTSNHGEISISSLNNNARVQPQQGGSG